MSFGKPNVLIKKERTFSFFLGESGGGQMKHVGGMVLNTTNVLKKVMGVCVMSMMRPLKKQRYYQRHIRFILPLSLQI